MIIRPRRSQFNAWKIFSQASRGGHYWKSTKLKVLLGLLAKEEVEIRWNGDLAGSEEMQRLWQSESKEKVCS